MCDMSCWLVVDADLDFLFRRRHDVVFCFALEVGEFCHGVFDDLQRLLQFFVRDDKGRS